MFFRSKSIGENDETQEFYKIIIKEFDEKINKLKEKHENLINVLKMFKNN